MRAQILVLLALGTSVSGGVLWLSEDVQSSTGLHILDVGQGDAILLRSGAADVLVDGGPDATVLQRLGEVRPAWDRTIEVLVVTHPQQDHLAGLIPLLEREQVGLVLLPEVPSESALFSALVGELQRRRIPVRFAREGQELTAGDLSVTVLAPGAAALRLGQRNANNGAVVLRVEVLQQRKPVFSALLTGDIERPAEHLLVQRWRDRLDVEVLKVAHHGSATSTTERLLRTTTPALALISVGAGNRYGHPAPAVVRRLAPIRTVRTDEHGTISLLAKDGSVTLAARGK